MSTTIATIQPALPAPLAPMFSPEQEKMLLSTFLGGASREEAAVLLEIVKRRRLDPFARQVYFVKRWDSQKREEVWAIQISIDGLRSLAERTGQYDGQDEPVYGKDEAGEFAKVKVYRKDWSAGHAAVGVAYLSEFIQKKKDGSITSFWARMPRLMLAKCAEALAIRKAFPEDTAGLYIPEEMGEESKALPTETPSAATHANETPPPETKPDTGAATRKRVMDLWERLLKQEKGNQKLAKMAWDKAAESVMAPEKSTAWTMKDAEAVEAVLWPRDVP